MRKYLLALGYADKLLTPDAQSGDLNEAELACGGFVVPRRQSAGTLHPVEATLDVVPQDVCDAVDRLQGFAVRPCGSNRRSTLGGYGVANLA